MNPILVEAMRGGLCESAHRGAVAVCDADGALVLALGDVERPIFPRSAVKVLQALPLVESGAADQLGLSDEELAIACASHNGEPAHTVVVERMLARVGLGMFVVGGFGVLLDPGREESNLLGRERMAFRRRSPNLPVSTARRQRRVRRATCARCCGARSTTTTRAISTSFRWRRRCPAARSGCSSPSPMSQGW